MLRVLAEVVDDEGDKGLLDRLAPGKGLRGGEVSEKEGDGSDKKPKGAEVISFPRGGKGGDKK